MARRIEVVIKGDAEALARSFQRMKWRLRWMLIRIRVRRVLRWLGQGRS